MMQYTEVWEQTYPGAHVGVMVMEGLSNPPQHAGLEKIKVEFEESLRLEYGAFNKAMLEELPTIRPYVAYYKKFNKTYHVLLQIESIASKGRSLPHVAALVEAMFIAELKNQLLTAGHDFDLCQPPFTLSAAGGNERYTLLSGQEQTLKAGDMFISDQKGVISSIIYGPDRRTPISASTRKVIFTVYAPEGVEEEKLKQHLADIRGYVELVSPDARLVELEIVGAL